MNPVLAEALKTRRISNAYLIESRSLNSIRDQAGDFLGALYCARESACGVCPPCKKLFSGSHPDVLIIETPFAGKNQNSSESGVEAFRETLTDFAYGSPFEGGYKVVFIPEADKLSEYMQNALLKMLEDTPKNTVFLLGARLLRRLLPTVLSRCIILRSAGDAARDASELAGELNLLPAEGAVLLKAAGRDYGLACEFGVEYFDIREDMILLLHALWEGKLSRMGEMTEILNKYKENLPRAVNIARIYIADIINYKYLKNPECLVNDDLSADISKQAARPDLKLAGAAVALTDFVAKYERCPGWNYAMAVSGTLLKILEVTA